MCEMLQPERILKAKSATWPRQTKWLGVAILTALLGLSLVNLAKVVSTSPAAPDDSAVFPVSMPSGWIFYSAPIAEEKYAVGSNANSVKSAKFNPSGDYFPLNKPPGGAEQFGQFDLQVRRRKGRLIVWGDVRSIGASYKFSSVSVQPKRLQFTTRTVRGVSYRFAGEFLGQGDFASQSTERGIVMLQGTLRMFSHGKEILKIASPFLYYAGC